MASVIDPMAVATSSMGVSSAPGNTRALKPPTSEKVTVGTASGSLMASSPSQSWSMPSSRISVAPGKMVASVSSQSGVPPVAWSASKPSPSTSARSLPSQS